MNFNIRVLSPNDVKHISLLVHDLAHFYINDSECKLPTWFATTLTDIEFLKRIENKEYSNFLYEIEGIVVGYISIKNNNHLYHLFVSELYQRKGIATQLWQYAANKCISNTYTVRSSLNAVPIYKKFGFVESSVVQKKTVFAFNQWNSRYYKWMFDL